MLPFSPQPLQLLLIEDGSHGLEPALRRQFAGLNEPIDLTVERRQDHDLPAIAKRPVDAIIVAFDLTRTASDQRLRQITATAGATPVFLIGTEGSDGALQHQALRAGALEILSVEDVVHGRFAPLVLAEVKRARAAARQAEPDGPPVPRWLDRTGWIAALILVLLGSAALLGWVVNSDTLTSIATSLPPLKIRAAIAFIFAGASLLLLRRPTTARRRVSGVLTVLLFVGSTLTLLESIFGRDLSLITGLDSISGTGTGRATPLMATAFLFFALTQLTLDSQGVLRRIHTLAALGFGSATLLAVQAWSIGSNILTGSGAESGVSVLGLAGLVLALAGAAAQRPDRKPVRWLTDDTPGAALMRRLAPAVLLAPPLLGLLRVVATDLGWWDEDFSLALFSTSVIVVPLILVVFTATAIDRREHARRRLADAVRASERRFRAFGTVAPIGIFEMDLAGNVTYVNSAWCQLTGLSPSEAWGKGWHRGMHPEDLPGILEADATPPGQERPGAEVFRAIRPDGTVIWLASRRTPTLDDDGTPVGFVGTITDVSALKEAEQAARLSEAQLQALLDHAPMSVSFRDRDGRLRAANRDALTRMGLSADEALGTALQDVTDPENARHIAAQERKVAETREAITFEVRANNLDGGTGTYFVTKYPVIDADGNVSGTGGLLIDITERRAAEEEAEEARKRFQLTFEQAPIGMTIAAADGRFVRVNRALCEITGYTEQQLLEMTAQELTHPDDLVKDQNATAAMFTGEISSLQTDKRFIRASGEPIWVSLHATVLTRSESGAPELIMGQVQDISEQRHLEGRLQHLANHDPLTGLLNRRGFDDVLDRHMAQVLRYGPRGALVILDIDHFKAVNDTFGHQAGDELIITVANLLRTRLRDTDAIARLGGDEFAVLLSEASPESAADVGASIVEAVRTGAAVSSGGRPHLVTGSVGIAPLDEAVQSAGNAMSNADQAMYDAKEAGRDRHKLYVPDRHDGPRKQAQLSWVRRIKDTLSDQQFQLFSQPILDLHSGIVRQHEVLLRMVDDGGKIILPAAFLPTAERYDLIQDIDRWVTKRSIETIAEYNAAGKELVLEVNLSGKSIGDQRLLDLVERQLRETPIDPTALIFEITETAAVADIPQARRFADHLTALGCRFALDDFGAGFGSLYYLKHLPFDYLKIDGEFITGCMNGGTDELVIEALVSIASGLGKETIAECVENEATQHYLRTKGVDYAQGNFVGHPEPLRPPGELDTRALRIVS